MKLETPDGRFFSLTVDGYEFPDEKLGPTEDNPADEFETGRFLVISHTFRNPDGEWHASAPTMTTDELARFAKWLEAIRGGGKPESQFYFTERDLEFTFDSQSNNLIVHVFYDFLPEWSRTDQTTTIEFSLMR